MADNQQPLFNSVQSALTFAFHYAGQQSPRTPMQRILQGGMPLGKGKGLSGLDGAAQAGMILGELSRRPREQQLVLRVRFGEARRECSCCGTLMPCQEWREAVSELARCQELEGVPPVVARAVVERAVCRRKWDAGRLSHEYGMSERTLYRRAQEVRQRLGKVENAAVRQLDEVFAQQGLIGVEVVA